MSKTGKIREHESAGDPTEVALIGDAATVSGEIKRLEDLGVTDLCGYAFQADTDAFERTVDFLGSLT